MTPAGRQKAYRQLLNDLPQVAPDRNIKSQDARAKATFSVWLSRRIHEQLGNAAQTEQMERQYQDLLTSLPDEEAAVFRLLFERVEKPQQVLVQRMGEVEANGKDVKVVAADYPIRSLLRKIAEAAGREIDIPPEVSGVADLDTKGWQRAKTTVSLFVRGRGLWLKPDVRDGFKITLRDPLYMASLAERAREQKVKPTPETDKEGITTGYVIVGGHYLEPPYKVDVRTAENQCAVYVNGVQTGASHKLSSKLRTALPVIKRDKPFTLKRKLGLSAYVGDMYAKLMRENGHAAAVESVGRFLETQKIVKSWRLDAERNELWITFVDGREVSAMLVWPKNHDRARQLPEVADVRSRALAKVQKRRTTIEETLRANGLVVAPTSGPVHTFKGGEAQEKLGAICQALQETLRYEEQLCDTLFDSWREEASGWAWEIFLNLRHRELVQRVAGEGMF